MYVCHYIKVLINLNELNIKSVYPYYINIDMLNFA